MKPVSNLRVSRIAAGVFCGLAIAVSVQTAARAQSYVPAQLADRGTSQETTTTTSTTTTVLKSVQVKGVTLQAVNPAFTGANSVPVAGLGALALGTGVVLRVAARKRKAR